MLFDENNYMCKFNIYNLIIYIKEYSYKDQLDTFFSFPFFFQLDTLKSLKDHI